MTTYPCKQYCSTQIRTQRQSPACSHHIDLQKAILVPPLPQLHAWKWHRDKNTSCVSNRREACTSTSDRDGCTVHPVRRTVNLLVSPSAVREAKLHNNRPQCVLSLFAFPRSVFPSASSLLLLVPFSLFLPIFVHLNFPFIWQLKTIKAKCKETRNLDHFWVVRLYEVYSRGVQ